MNYALLVKAIQAYIVLKRASPTAYFCKCKLHWIYSVYSFLFPANCKRRVKNKNDACQIQITSEFVQEFSNLLLLLKNTNFSEQDPKAPASEIVLAENLRLSLMEACLGKPTFLKVNYTGDILSVGPCDTLYDRCKRCSRASTGRQIAFCEAFQNEQCIKMMCV